MKFIPSALAMVALALVMGAICIKENGTAQSVIWFGICSFGAGMSATSCIIKMLSDKKPGDATT